MPDAPLGRTGSGFPSLSVTGLTKSFAGHVAINQVSLTIAAGEIHALLGENGSGKSTLIKVLSGYHKPDAGEVIVAGQSLHLGSVESSYQLGCRFVHQDLGLVGDCSVLDNLSLNAGYPSRLGTIRSRAARLAAREALDRVRLDVDLRRTVAELSPAVQTGIAVARALRQDESAPVHLLVLDEPTATLPHDEVDQLLEIVRQVAAQGVGILYVSHRLAEVRRLANSVTVLRDGSQVAYRDIDDLPHDELIELLSNGKLGPAVEQRPDDSAGGPVVLQATKVGSGQLRGLSLEVRRGEILGIAGLTGSGREASLAALFGAVTRLGEVTVDGVKLKPGRPDLAVRAGVAYLPPDRKVHGGVMNLTAAENITLTDLSPFWHGLRLRHRSEMTEADEWFTTLGIRPAHGAKAKLETFSGGNQQKVLFAKWLRRRPRVLLLDEPTQGVDIAAKADLHEQIADAARSGSAVIVSSADLEELVSICNRILVIRDGDVVAELAGNDTTVPNLLKHTLGGELART